MINTELKKHPIKDEIGDSELKMLFRMFDVDSSGFITASEYKMCLIALGEEATEEEIDETMREADKNGDGKISFEEFSKMMEDSDSDSELREAFDELDKDGSGHISASEMRSFFEDFARIDTDMMIAIVDSNCDGKLSFEEFARLDQLIKAWGA